MSQVVIRKSSPVVVRPSTPVPTPGDVKLSFFDKNVVDMPAIFIFVFDHPIPKPAETIKSALSQALVHYYPLAGRLDLGADDGKPFIRCSGEGVVFVAATADCALKDMELLDRPLRSTTPLDELAVDYPGERCSRGEPLMILQVTEFACGGFIIGLTRNHVVSDAAGMAQFLQAVGELARGLPAPTIVPVRYDESFPGIPPVVAAPKRTLTEAPEHLSFLDVIIPSSFIDKIKANFSKMYSDCKPCTVFEVVAAVLWQCRTRAIMSDTEAPTMLFFTGSARKLVGAKRGYYGNCVTSASLTETSGAVANRELMDIVKMIKQAKEQMVVKMPSSEDKGGGGSHDDIRRNMYNNLGLSSQRHLGLDEVDFGGGTPARVMNRVPHIGLPICAVCLPWKGKDGANVLTNCVKEEHVDAFAAELARITT